ncbi:MAG: ABC transporter permease [Verrucomicrobia bacterium]|nr:ABC transporter permease [Verrucomicrobiota bacterium]
MNDLKFAFRQLLKNPGFTAVAVVMLALGLGANLAIFTFANAMLLRPLPGLRDPAQLVILRRASGAASHPDYRDLRDQNTVFTDLAASAPAQFSFSANNVTERVMGEFVSGNYFRTLGVSFAAGRDFLPEEDAIPGRHPVAIISHRLWQGRWNNDPAAVGQQVAINGQPFTIVGVAGEQFRGYVLPTAYDLWVPIHAQPLVQPSQGNRLEDRGLLWLRRFVGRLKQDVTLGQVEASVAVILDRIATEFPRENRSPREAAYAVGAYNPFGAAGKPRQALMFLGILMATTLLVLVVVCANVANLILTRALAGQREVAIRLALGSSRWRLVRQALAEGLVIALLGAALGSLTAREGAEMLFAHIPGDAGEPMTVDAVVDGRVLGMAIALALFSTVGCGLMPSLRVSRLDPLPVLKGGEGSHSARATRLGSALIVTQVALCAVLRTAAGLLFRSLQLVYSIDPRLRIDNLFVAEVDPHLNGYDSERTLLFYEQLLPRLGALPGVESASFAALVPMSGRNTSFGRVHGGDITQEDALACNANIVGPDYFRTLGIALLRGREFSAVDRRDAPRVTIVNQTLASRLWPDQEALGQFLSSTAANEPPWLVVGVVSDSIYVDLTLESKQPQPFYYLPVFQRTGFAQHLLLRTMGQPLTLLPSVRGASQELDPHLPIFHVKTLKTVRDQAFWQQRIAVALTTAAGWLAILLATLGLYSAMAQQVTNRTREIGIRMALGARRGDVLRVIVRHGIALAGVGIVIGLAGAFALTRVLRSLLVGVSPTDPITFVVIPMLLGLVTLLACWFPARRATKVEPMEALRHE